MTNLPMGTTTKNDLVIKFQEGCARAFSAVYDELSPFLYLYARKLTKDKAIAEEIVQDAFVALFHKRSGLDLTKGLTGIKAYLIVCIQHRTMRTLEIKAKAEARIRELSHHIPVAQDPEVFRQEIVSSIYHRMRQEIKKLSKTQRQVFELLFIEERTPEEASQILHLSKKTVENAKSHIVGILKSSELHFTTILPIFIALYLESYN
ncbi:RNA polymerase sigma factor [Pseudoflavitalea sp. X16]|uniref:RNA polymerase sigma factor n=1 Tax=Paraflavitalea devenefica TaxID=2716334 RepID=UPI001422855C|nr:RNA polymerase sigma factor [Paraflavitalea devenefica]NII26142.1 RNA polymerase sigma factor [Paraflavitalea devenefica]